MHRIFYGILYTVSLLPLGLLYVFSNFLYFMMNYVIGYRKKIIKESLQNSFPDKSDKEINKIRKSFYKNFSDYLVETLKSFSITQKELDKRHTYSNLEIFDECKKEGKDVMMMTGHVFNWEWFIGTVEHLPSQNTVAVYRKINNQFWENKINEMRSRFGTHSLEKDNTVRYMLKSPNNGETTYLFLADQSPYKTDIHYDLTFLNQLTPVFNGFDKIAARLNMAVIYCNTVKIKQGQYHTTFERIHPDNEKFEENEVIHKFFQSLEKTIRKNPDNWLWSHRRWKYKRGIDY